MGAKKSYGSQEEEHKPFKERIAERTIAHQARYDRRRRPRAGWTVPRITCHSGALASRCHRLESTAYADERASHLGYAGDLDVHKAGVWRARRIVATAVTDRCGRRYVPAACRRGRSGGRTPQSFGPEPRATPGGLPPAHNPLPPSQGGWGGDHQLSAQHRGHAG